MLPLFFIGNTRRPDKHSNYAMMRYFFFFQKNKKENSMKLFFFFLKLKQASARDLLGKFKTDADLDRFFVAFLDLTKDQELNNHGSNPGMVIQVKEQVDVVINAAMERENKLNASERLVLFVFLFFFFTDGSCI